MTKGMKITLGVVGVAAAIGVGYMIYKKMQAPKTMNAAGPSSASSGSTTVNARLFGGGKKQYCPCKSGIRSSKCCGGQDATAGGE